MDKYISIDLEMTGLNPKLDKIIEIGAVKVIDKTVTDRFSMLVNPKRLVPQNVSELTGITDDELKEALAIEEILPKLSLFMEDYPILGHGIMHDFSFLKKAFVDNKMEFKKSGVDTLKIARVLLDGQEKKTLGALCEKYGIELTAHRAVNDALATSQLYEKLKEEYYRTNPSLFIPGELFYSIKRDVPATKVQKERIEKMIKLLGEDKVMQFLPYGVEKESLTRSEADRFICTVLSKYGKL